MQTILITQCLQNDFVKALGPNEPLPNMLHIGHDESKRLIGTEKESGPLAHFMSWANDHIEQHLDIIHIRDWHNPNASEQQKHLQQFGEHCIQNTQGADFAFPLAKNCHVHIVDSTTLNDFQNTNLAKILNAYNGKTVKVGIIGVWTEAKIQFLAYELATRYDNFEIVVCSALTASSSRSQHFLALRQIDNILGVQVVDSIGEFIEFLGGDKNDLTDLLSTAAYQTPDRKLNISINGELKLQTEDEKLLHYLFRDCKELKLKVLDGGFSGNIVASAQSIDIQGHEQAPHVIKIGPRNLMAKERIAFEQIEKVLGNNAPAIAEYADFVERGAIKYRYASMDSGKVRTLQDEIQNSNDTDKIKIFLDIVFQQQLGRFYRAYVHDKQDLLSYYCFSPNWADSVKSKMNELIGDFSDRASIEINGSITPNLHHFYRDTLKKNPGFIGDFPFAFIHGDLNGANVILDSGDNTWIIDFFHAHKGHVFKDFAKLENDLLYIYTPIDDDETLTTAFAFTDFLLAITNIFDKLPKLPEKFANTPFEKTYLLLEHIRHLALPYAQEETDSLIQQWWIAQMRYAVHTIGFDEPNNRQRIWALYTASHLGEKIKNFIC